MKKKNIVNAIKQIEGLRKEKDDNSMKDKLINAINYEMEQVGNTDVVIDNIRFLQMTTNSMQWQTFPTLGG